MKPALPVLVLGGPGRRGAVAGRIAGDLSEAGLAAVPATVTEILDGDPADAAGVVVVHASGDWWPDGLSEALVARRNSGQPVAIVRADSSRLPPFLHGFACLVLIPGESYAPGQQESGGYEHLFTIFAPRRKRPERRPPAVFLSYSRANTAFVDNTLVPLLRSRRIVPFDFQYTERLDTATLGAELQRCVVASAVLLVVATHQWRLSHWCALELDVARKHHKPIVAVWPQGVGRHRAPQLGEGVRVVSFGRDVDAARERLMSVLGRILP